MPISRKKACHDCRLAKARCNLSVPRCSRCIERGSRCEYDHSRPGPCPRPAADGSTASPVTQLIDTNVSVGSDITPPGDAWSAIWDELNFGSQLSPSMLTPSMPFSPFGFNHSDGQPSRNVDTEIQAPSPNTKLLKRAPESAHEFFALKVMLGQLESYPKMMIEGVSLPPFIHSRCALDDTGSFECRERHTCLSEHLSICASLVNLFYTRTPTNSDFVWKTIYAEQERIHREYLTYDNETLLEAIQAVCIYVILQAEDQESQMRNDPHSLIQTMGDLGTKVHTGSGYENYECLNPINRRVWVSQESTRRTICLLYFIEALPSVIIGERDAVSCQGFERMPLSCSRSLWEVKSTSEWAKQYRESFTKRQSSRVVTISDLKKSMRLPTSQLGDKGDESVLSDIMAWCQGLDQFGTLIWMAITVSRGII